jgi:hypothetical protein
LFKSACGVAAAVVLVVKEALVSLAEVTVAVGVLEEAIYFLLLVCHAVLR